MLAKTFGTISKPQREIPPQPLPPRPPGPMQCCHVAVFMYGQNDFSGFQHCLGEGGRGKGGLPKIHSDISNKFMAIGYRYPEHYCTLQTI